MTKILRAGRTVTDDVVAYDIGWDDDLNGGESVLWSMLVTSEDGDETVQLGYKVVDGVFSAQFVFDHVSARQVNVGEDVTLGEGEITVRFPTDVVGAAGQWPVWKAIITVDGSDVAEHLATPAT